MKKSLGYEAKVPASLEGGYKLISSYILGHINGLIPDKQYDKTAASGIYSKNKEQKNEIDKACENGKEILNIVTSKDGSKLNEEFKTAHSLKWTYDHIKLYIYAGNSFTYKNTN